MNRPYIASDDSALLRTVLATYSGATVLEIGAGNGGNLIELKNRFRRVVGTDLQRPGARDWKGEGADYILADGASCLQDGSFDLVAFNPPYLPLEMTNDLAVEGGKGLEVPMKFLQEALRVVKRNGKVVLLLNDQAPVEMFEAACARKGFALRKVAARHLFFEELSVYEATAE
jgi:release factor glutamine methyltransferase